MRKLYTSLLLLAAASPVFAQSEPDVKPAAARGIYAIWYEKKPEVLRLPYIKGGQIVMQWAEVEPARGKYDFSQIDKQLAKFKAEGRMTTIQVNGNNKPAWMYEVIPHHSELLSHQIADKQGTLMFWHPVFVESYVNFVKAYAAHLKASPNLSALAGVRMNFNALGTEQLDVPAGKTALNQWIVPKGSVQGPAYTAQTSNEYQQRLSEVFIDSFDGINLFMRNNLPVESEAKYRQKLLTGKLMLFHTSSEIEPRSIKNERIYHLFYEYAHSGKTLAYAEPWADAWGYHGAKQDPRWTSPPQYIYWRLLFDLNCGVSIPAIYSADLGVALNGTHPKMKDVKQYQESFSKAIKFASAYAGYHASPGVAPGAWVAFRHNEKNASYQEFKEFTDDYNFLMKELPPAAPLKPVIKAGPDLQRFGAFAKVLAQGQAVRLQMSGIYTNSLKGKPAVVRVVYLDNGKGSFETAFSGQKIKTDLTDSGEWKTAEFSVSNAAFDKDSGGAQVSITALTGDITLHLVAVERGTGLPNEVTETAVKANGTGATLSWKNPLDYDIDHLNIYNGTKVIKTATSVQEQADLSDVKGQTLTIKTVDEAGRESKGVTVKL